MLGIYRRLDSNRAIGLQHTVFHAAGHFGGSVPDVNLPTTYVQAPAINGSRFGECGDRMFGSRIRTGIGSRGMCGNLAIVNDPSTTRVLLLHDPEGMLRAKKCSCNACIKHTTPLFIAQVFERDCGRANTSIVE